MACTLTHRSNDVKMLANLRKTTGEEGRRQTLCDKHDNNFVWNNFWHKLHFPLNGSSCKRPGNIDVSEDHDKTDKW